jgi:aspartyl-tRNA synthetase
MFRTKNNGELRLSNVGEEVTLVGWVSKKRNLGSLVFIDLRDRYGYTQVLLEDEKFPIAKEIRNEYIIQVKGIVQKKDVPNTKLPTGEIEVVANEVKIVNTAEQTPFIIADDTDALEDTRLKYRYLDLRRPMMQNYLKTRAKIVRACHEYLDSNDFIEVETPILTLSTPEGARDFLVPSRMRKGSFYALPQSPQLFKQMLMVAGFERYYQVARCFRDEDLRADRQPDFTQVDIETSFLSEDEILTMTEGLIKKIFKDVKGIDVKTPLRRIPYDYCIEHYGSDKPDTRFGLELHDVKDILSKINFEAFQEARDIRAIVIPNKAKETTRKVIDNLNLHAKKFGLKGLTVLKFENSELTGSFTKFFNEDTSSLLAKALELKEDDLVLIAAGNKMRVCPCLGALRTDYAKTLGLIKKDTYDLLWVVDFPLFDYNEDTKEITPCHHPFTQPKEEDIPKLKDHPEQVYAAAYDIVINGYEAGGGSLRIYDQNLQKEIFELLGFTEEDIQRKFGFFVNALKYGTPPHGGLAFGLDRWAMILGGTENIRDVIAFPKNLSAVCPMSNAPLPVDDAQLDDLGIQVKDEFKGK